MPVGQCCAARPAGTRALREAEREGFEPSTHLSAGTRFPVAFLRPLGHLSGAAERSGWGPNGKAKGEPACLDPSATASTARPDIVAASILLAAAARRPQSRRPRPRLGGRG